MDQCFALTAGPFSTHMLFDGEHARRVIQLLADVLADALKLTATSALRVFQFVMNHGTLKLGWQRYTLGFLMCLLWSRGRQECAQFGVDSLKISIEQVVKRVALLGVDLLTAFGKPVSLEDGDFMSQLFDEGLIVMVLPTHGVDLRHQLRC